MKTIPKTIEQRARDLVMSVYGLTFQSQMNPWQRDFTARIATAFLELAREVREQDAQLMCHYCRHPEKYGPSKKIEGSTRMWHKEIETDTNVTCSAAAIRATETGA